MRPATFEAALDLVLGRLRALLLRKHAAYGVTNLLASGEAGIAIRCGDKVGRLRTLAGRRPSLLRRAVGWALVRLGLPPLDESAEDTWLDLAGYAVMAVILRHGWLTLPMQGERKERD